MQPFVKEQLLLSLQTQVTYTFCATQFTFSKRNLHFYSTLIIDPYNNLWYKDKKISLSPLEMSACVISVSRGNVLQRPQLTELNTFVFILILPIQKSGRKT